jgi:hypothetical protein
MEGLSEVSPGFNLVEGKKKKKKSYLTKQIK